MMNNTSIGFHKKKRKKKSTLSIQCMQSVDQAFVNANTCLLHNIEQSTKKN